MSKKKWTKDEERLLIKEFPVKTNKELSEMFNRSEKSIVQRAHALKLYKDKQKLWSDDEVKFLKDHYNIDMQPSEIAAALKRSSASIKTKAFSIGLADHVQWTEEQLEYLIDRPDKVEDIRKVVKDYVQREFDWDVVSNKTEEAYKMMVS